MTKIMLVEDDNNLREIYEARLLAEGYEIVSAKDGEEALATAVKEKPDLIISDVMMPKISGFDMLDILRSTPETKNTKVIMMTALSQAEDKARADKLGADKYLVKSQVTLEDVARVAREVISGEASPGIDSVTPGTPAPAAGPVASSDAGAPTVAATDVPSPASPVAADPIPIAQIVPGLDPPASSATPAPPTSAPAAAEESIGVVDAPAKALASPSAVKAPEIEVKPEEDKSESGGSSKRIIQPLNDLSVPAKDLNDLAAKEDALEAAQNPEPSLPPVNPDAPAADTVIAPSPNNTTS